MNLDETEIIQFMFGKLLDEEDEKGNTDLKKPKRDMSQPEPNPAPAQKPSPEPEPEPEPGPESGNTGESGDRGDRGDSGDRGDRGDRREEYPRDNDWERGSGRDESVGWGERGQGQGRDIDMSSRNTVGELSPNKSIDLSNSQSDNSKEETQQSDIQILEDKTPEQTEKSSEIKRKKTKEKGKFVKGKRTMHIPDVHLPKKMSKQRYIPVMERATSSRSFKPPNREIKTPRKKVFKKKLKIESLDPEGELLISSSRKKLRRNLEEKIN